MQSPVLAMAMAVVKGYLQAYERRVDAIPEMEEGAITEGVSAVEALHNVEYLRLVPPFSKVAQACRQIMAGNNENRKEAE